MEILLSGYLFSSTQARVIILSILYLGDSENDNPAFRKASISVGIISDKSSNPKLDCQYLIEYKHLPKFLGHLADNKFVFSERLLNL